jgi:hypothetical protein
LAGLGLEGEHRRASAAGAEDAQHGVLSTIRITLM